MSSKTQGEKQTGDGMTFGSEPARQRQHAAQQREEDRLAVVEVLDANEAAVTAEFEAAERRQAHPEFQGGRNIW